MNLTCYYSCKLCGVTKKSIEIPERLLDQDIVDWIENIVAKTIAKEHRMLFLFCRNTKIDELMIPTMSSKGIGFPTEN